MDQITNFGAPFSCSAFRTTFQPDIRLVSCRARDSPNGSGANSNIRTGEEAAKRKQETMSSRYRALAQFSRVRRPFS